MDVTGRDLATFAVCAWVVTIGLYYLDLGIPLKPLLIFASTLSVAGFVVSLRRRERIAAGVSIISLAPIALLLAAVLVIALGGGWDR